MNDKIAPVIDHVCMRVTNDLGRATEFLETLGWIREKGRNPMWDTGRALFFHHPKAGVYIQLNYETSDRTGRATDAFHIGLAFTDVGQALVEIEAWCRDSELSIEIENLGGGKHMVKIPELFYGAFELVPQ